jgi:predicted O-methyltransferase YrrM
MNKYGEYREKMKQKGLFSSWHLSKISPEDLDPMFKTNHLGLRLETEVRFVGRGSLNVPGGTSDAEAWILSALAKKAKNIFEFGTCTGKTTYLFAANSPEETKVTTITLSPNEIEEYQSTQADSKDSIQDALEESVFTDFLYSNTPEEKKIVQLFGDSKTFDESPYHAQMDLIFIDGSHAYSYVLSDSEKALKMIKPGGLILWHDYRGPREVKDVYKALNGLSSKIDLKLIEGMSLAVHRAPLS